MIRASDGWSRRPKTPFVAFGWFTPIGGTWTGPITGVWGRRPQPPEALLAALSGYSAASASGAPACGPRTSAPGSAPVITPLRKVTCPRLMVIT
jgi:hypothetical protein